MEETKPHDSQELDGMLGVLHHWLRFTYRKTHKLLVKGVVRPFFVGDENIIFKTNAFSPLPTKEIG